MTVDSNLPNTRTAQEDEPPQLTTTCHKSSTQWHSNGCLWKASIPNTEVHKLWGLTKQTLVCSRSKLFIVKRLEVCLTWTKSFVQLTATQTCLQRTTQLTPSPVLQPDAHTNSLKNAFQLLSILNWFHPAHKVSVFSTSVCGVAFWAPHPNSQPWWPGYLSSSLSETCPAWVDLPAARLQLAQSAQPAKNMVSRR